MAIKEARAERIRGFDGIRGLAALAVVVHHTIIYNTRLGSVAVELFFEISGFLILGMLYDARSAVEQGRSNAKSELLHFWRNRALRIFPVYYTALLSIFVLSVFLPRLLGSVIGHFLWYLTYTQNFLIAFITKAWGPFTQTWTLAVEQQFYVLFALIFLFIPTNRFRLAFAVLALLCVGANEALVLANQRKAISTLPFDGFIYIIAGGWISISQRRWTRHNASAKGAELTLWVLAVAIVVYSVLPSSLANLTPAALTSLPLAISMGVFIVLLTSNPNSGLARFLEMRWLVSLGSLSYALYVVHAPVAAIVSRLEAGHVTRGRRAIFFLATLGISLILSVMSRKFIERPALALKTRRRARASAVEPSKVLGARPETQSVLGGEP